MKSLVLSLGVAYYLGPCLNTSTTLHLLTSIAAAVLFEFSQPCQYFLAADFDEDNWREDARALMQSCHELSIPAALEISRSGNGAHVWIFVADSVLAREARQLGTCLISHTCDRTRHLSLESRVDECHHLSAVSFEAIIKQAKAKYVLGLTATPVRRNGHQPIIFMQCGPVRHSATRAETAPTQLEVWPRLVPSPEIPADSVIQEVFRILTTNAVRNKRIALDILAAHQEGRKVLVLTERTQHLELLREALSNESAELEHCFVLHGRLPKKKRTRILADLAELDDATPRILLATGRLIGEGFDHPPLDTLVLAMPISWKGTLQQYAGRLHREHAHKQDVRIYDYVENDQPQLARMWGKRQRGYRAMGYQILPAVTP